MTKPPVLILGARSDIGKAIAHKFAALGHTIRLGARNALTLEADKTDVELRYGVSVSLHEFDGLATETHDVFVAGLPELPQVAICAVGLMGQQAKNERDITTAICVMRNNYVGPASIVAILATDLKTAAVTLLSASVQSPATVAWLQTRSTALRNRASRHSSQVYESVWQNVPFTSSRFCRASWLHR